MGYSWCICDPFKPDLQEMGAIGKEKIMETFLQHPWQELSQKMNDPDCGEIFFSPTVSFSETDRKIEITFSYVGVDEDEFMICYNGKDQYGDKTGFDMPASQKMLEAFLNNDLTFIEQRIF